MLHRVSIAAAVVAAALCLPAAAHAQNPRGEAKLALGGKTVSVDYGRPSLRGRDMLGKAEVGQEWRMGADGATTLNTTGELSFGAVKVPAGDYTLKARKVSASDWVLKFEKDEKAVAEVPLQATSLAQSVEMFTIDLAQEQGQGVFRMSWGTRALAARFTAK